MNVKRPYLIITKLIEQPTWGGSYICQLKAWNTVPFLEGKKIGQSYELFGGSKLAVNITDSHNPDFTPELGFADKPDTVTDHFHLQPGTGYVTIADFIKDHGAEFVGEKVWKAYHGMPLLIKLNQASGNSFQLHLRPHETHSRWKPKAESWYYLQNGRLTFGIKRGIDIQEYKRVCHKINTYMQELSTKIKTDKLTLTAARAEALAFVAAENPWKFVNVHEAEKNSIIDLSRGGIHHSWEENTLPGSPGNVIYEVQQDVMDPDCTIRSFDQGKIKDSGDIREIHIDDYFAAIDTDPDHNDIAQSTFIRKGNELLRTPIYNVDLLTVENKVTDSSNDTFAHLFVESGNVEVSTVDGTVAAGTGHSVFIPHACGEYEITALDGTAKIVKTFM